tara:strand:+ start:27 stop:812 length:786 start_codon:yes stop_codon:yes gene_type:complete
MSEIIQLNNFAKLHNGANILFCKTDYLGALFQHIDTWKTPCTLITGNSDYPITDDIVSHAPPCIQKWYAQNSDTTNPKVKGIPLGIENSEDCVLDGHGVGWEHAKEKINLLKSPPEIKTISKIYANFSLSTHVSRKEVQKICESIECVTTNLSANHAEINDRSYHQYVSDILSHEMTVCPRGNGIDCHRVWEVLYLGRVPIVKRENAMRYFEELPILFIDDWSHLRNIDYIENQYQKVKDNNNRMLDMNYWKNIIQGEKYV